MDKFNLREYLSNNPLLKENVGGAVEIEFQNWLDEMSTKFEDEKITLQTVIDYAQDTLKDYAMDDWAPDDGEYEETFTPNPDDITMMSDEDEELNENEPLLTKNIVGSKLLGPGGTFDKIDRDIKGIEDDEKIEYLKNVINYATEVIGDINDGSHYGLRGKK
tara:strand:+ start:843 stop:1328 length:486 start_codon:yes stop_codon:yes gene_type:complete